MRIPFRRCACGRSGFTLVELLVVIGIIALLISILLPALSKARNQANTVKCLSNVKQLALAAKLFAADHKGYIPTSTSDAPTGSVVRYNDAYMQKWIYRNSNGTPTVSDWASSLMLYLGFKDTDANNFQNQNSSPNPSFSPPKVFACPNDSALDGQNPGYMLYNNIAPPTSYFPVSYGINADITCLTGPEGKGWFTLSAGSIVVTGGGFNFTPLNSQIDRVAFPSQTLLFADCGTRPTTADTGSVLNWPDALYYTTNGMSNNSQLSSAANLYQQYTLQGTVITAYMSSKIPLKRHGGKINVAFCDGHAATVPSGSFNTVKISPFK